MWCALHTNGITLFLLFRLIFRTLSILIEKIKKIEAISKIGKVEQVSVFSLKIESKLSFFFNRISFERERESFKDIPYIYTHTILSRLFKKENS